MSDMLQLVAAAHYHSSLNRILFSADQLPNLIDKLKRLLQNPPHGSVGIVQVLSTKKR